MFKHYLYVILVSIFTAFSSISVQAVPIKSDFVFVIDATSSMSGEIAGVRNGLASFVGGLNAASVDARFSIILFGGAPELVLDFTSDTTATQTAFNNITIGAKAGFQNNHNVNPEAGLEAVRMALGAATYNDLQRNNVGGTGGLNFRNDARKNIILVTDEDSDRPYYTANRFAGESTNEPSSPTPGSGWQAEVDATAQAIIDNDAFINMLINIGDNPSKSQYGDYTKDVSDADLLNFDADATLNNLLADPLTMYSLQAQVLGAGLIGRSFNVAGANDPNFVNNFFAAKVQEVVENPVEPNPIPEPATLILLLSGLMGISYSRRSKC